jgi:hypothetical protein
MVHLLHIKLLVLNFLTTARKPCDGIKQHNAEQY